MTTYTYECAAYGNVEDLDRYAPGGFLPAIIGSIIGENGRFELVEKLGSGGFGTVWLARDQEQNKWKAIKILASSTSEDPSCGELVTLRQFEGVPRAELEANHLCLAEEYFWQNGPYGRRHLCLVLPVLGSPITNLWRDYGDQPDILKGICAQLVKAMNFLHSKGICHGDFRNANVLFKLKDIEDLSEEEILAMLPQSQEIKIVECDVDGNPIVGGEMGKGLPPNLPQYVYTSSSLIPTPDHTTLEIMVCDFGEAYHVSAPPCVLGIPIENAAPEIILGGDEIKPGFGTDIWALGSLLCEVRLGETPFYDDGINGWINSIEDFLGPLPEPYRREWVEQGFQPLGDHLPASEIPLTQPVSVSPEGMEERKVERLAEHGYRDHVEQLIRSRRQFGTPVEEGDAENLRPCQHIDQFGFKITEYQVTPQEADQLLNLLGRIFKYLPSERLPTSNIMTHPWLAGSFDTTFTSSQRKFVTNVTAVTETAMEDDPMEDITIEDTSVDDTVVKDSGISHPSPTLASHESDEDSDSMEPDIDARDAAAGITVEDHPMEETTPEEVQYQDPTMPQFRPSF